MGCWSCFCSIVPFPCPGFDPALHNKVHKGGGRKSSIPGKARGETQRVISCFWPHLFRNGLVMVITGSDAGRMARSSRYLKARCLSEKLFFMPNGP